MERIRRNLRICSHLLKKLLMEKFIFGADKFHFSCLFRTGICRNFRDTSSNLFSFKDFMLNKPVWGCGWFKLSVESLYPGLSKLTKNIHLKSSAPYISCKSSLSGFWLFPGSFLLLLKRTIKNVTLKWQATWENWQQQ